MAGSLQPYINAGRDERVQQNQYVARFARGLMQAGAKVVLALGDFNEFQDFPSMDAVSNGKPFFDIIPELVPFRRTGSYTFGPNT